MLYILHGDDTVSLRKRISDIIPDQGISTFFSADKATAAEILDALRSIDMFSDAKYTVIDKILKLSKKDMDAILPELNKASVSSVSHVVLCHDFVLSKVFIAKFKGSRSETFLMPKLFFTFLDNLSPKSFRQELTLLLQMENIEAEQIFYAMIKRIRQLIVIKTGLESEEVVKMSPWQFSKIRAQSTGWTVPALQNFYKELFEIEVKIKSSGLVLPLKKQLDIMLIAELH